MEKEIKRKLNEIKTRKRNHTKKMELEQARYEGKMEELRKTESLLEKLLEKKNLITARINEDRSTAGDKKEPGK